MMQPGTPRRANSVTSLAVVTPPDAMIGNVTVLFISSIASKFGPLIIPSRAMSV